MNIKNILKGSVAGAALVALSAPAFTSEAVAADDKPIKSGNKGSDLVLYGQVNRFVGVFGDGDNIDAFNADNDQTSSRFGLRATGKVNESLTFGANIELDVESLTSNGDITNENSGAPAAFDGFATERKIEFWIDHKQFGRIWVGQGSELSDGFDQGDDQSVTKIVANASNNLVFDGAEFLFDDGSSSGLGIGELLESFDTGRTDRIQYDTPFLFGFQLRAQVLNGGETQASARFRQKFGAFRIQSRYVYANQESFTGTQDVTHGSSLSVKHDSGFSISTNVTFTEEDDTGPLPSGDETEGARNYYFKLAYDTKGITDLGTTAFAVDYQRTVDLGFEANDSFAQTIALSFVQQFDKAGAEIYASVRWFGAEIGSQDLINEGTITAAGAAGFDADVDDIWLGIIGSRVKF